MVIHKVKTDIPSLDDLSLPPALKELALSDQGLILVAGAAKSGKSTTLAAMIDHRNMHGTGHIVSIEDPIEFTHQHKNCIVTQREVGTDTPTFHEALCDSMQQAAEMIVISEIRDAKTMETAVGVAESGYLCLATLPTLSASHTLEHILAFFAPPRQAHARLRLAANLRALIAQRLIDTSSGNPAAVVELLRDCPQVRNLIKKEAFDKLEEVIEKDTEHGCQTFDQSLVWLCSQGKITQEDAVANADSAANIRLKIKLTEAPSAPAAAKTIKQAQPAERAEFRIKGIETTHERNS